MRDERENTIERPVLSRQVSCPFDDFKPSNDRDWKKAEILGEELGRRLNELLPDDELKLALYNQHGKKEGYYAYRCFKRKSSGMEPINVKVAGGRYYEFLGYTSYKEAISNIHKFGHEQNPIGHRHKIYKVGVSFEPLWRFLLPDSKEDRSIVLVYEDFHDFYIDVTGFPPRYSYKDKLVGYVEVRWV